MILNWMFPPRCTLCRTALTQTQTHGLCPDCLARIPQYRWRKTVLMPKTQGAAVALRYSGQVRKAMQRYKFLHQKQYAAWFAQQSLPVLQKHLAHWQPDIITYIPIGWWRLHTRGYNQSELIAARVAKACALPCTGLLRKRPFVGMQSRKSRSQRQKDVQSAFLAHNAQAIAGRRIVLLDDVWTTGATLHAASQVLLAQGAQAVFVFAVTKVP